MKSLLEEFDKIKSDITNNKPCVHEVVKLYYNGTHSDYGGIKCKMIL